MKNTKIKWLIYVMAIGLFLSACGVRESDREGAARAEAAETIETSLENSPEETEPDAVSPEETGPDAVSPEKTESDAENQEKTGAGETASGENEPGADSSAGRRDFDLDMVPVYSGNAYADINDDIPFFTEDELTAEPFQEYWPLDEFGRCTGAFACIGPELLPTEVRENQSAATPAGWHSVKYDGIDGGYLYNRCHLIGYQLTGQTVNEKNLITGTRYMNLEGMLPFENSVRMYVEGTGNHVLYRVRPYYRGGNLLAEGVLMEAKSIEDPLVQFCAFCYNVQPGIEIDYATGESFAKGVTAGEAGAGEEASGEEALGEEASGEEASGVVASGEAVTKDAVAEDNASDGGEILAIVGDPGLGDRESPARSIEDETSAEEPVETTYILNTNTKRFHYPYCNSVKDMKDKNKRETTQSRDEIIGQGYQPCKRCNP